MINQINSFHRMLSEVSSGAGDSGGLSSDDGDLATVPQKLVIGAAGEPTLNAPGVNGKDLLDKGVFQRVG